MIFAAYQRSIGISTPLPQSVIFTMADSMTNTCSSTYPTYPVWHNNIIVFNDSTRTYSVYNPTTCTNNTVASTCFPIILQWPDWHDHISMPNIIQERMEAENARLELQRQAIAEANRIEMERAKERRLSSEKAKQLLLEHLTSEQRETVEKNGWFVIEGGRSKKRYRIRSSGVTGNVEEMDGERVIAKYCCHISHSYPRSDHHLTQKLMLEWDEETFLRLANKTAIGS